MAALERFITLTTAEPTKRIAMDGPHRVDIIGTFGSGSIAHYSFTEKAGRGAEVEKSPSAATASYASQTPHSEFDMTGSTGATVDIILTPIIQVTSS